MVRVRQSRKGSVFTMMMATVAMVGVVGVAGMNLVTGPITTASKITHQNMAQNDLLMNAKVVVMNASTRPQMGDEDGDGYVEPVPFIPTTESSCNISLPAGGQGGCLPADIGAILTDPWGTQYAYCVWDHGDPRSSTNRIDGEDSTSGAVLAIISAGPNKRFETPCLPYDGDPATNDDVITSNGIGDDLVQIYTYAAAVAGSGGLWELKLNEPETAVINKKLEIGDVGAGTGFAFDTQTGTGEFPYVRTDFLASKSGGTTPVTMDSNLALDGRWLSGDGGDNGIYISLTGGVSIGTTDEISKLTVAGRIAAYDGAFNILRHGNSASGGYARGVSIFSSGDTTTQEAGIGFYGGGDQPPSRIYIAHGQSAHTSPLGVHILSNGNVGISTTEPREKFAIGKGHTFHTGGWLFHGFNTYYDGQPRYGGYLAGSAYAARIDFAPDIGRLSLGVSATPGTEGAVADVTQRLTITPNGNVGIGTTAPISQLHLQEQLGEKNALTIDADHISYVDDIIGAIEFRRFLWDPNGRAASINFHRGGAHTEGALSFSTNPGTSTGQQPTERLRITHSGNVGLGTSTPTQKLQVAGHVDVTNNRILRVATPVVGTDAANKAYVDSLGNRTCANAQILKYQSGSWQCAADNSGGGADNLGGGGTTTGTLYSQNASGYGYIGQDGSNYFRFDAGAGTNRILTRIGAEWVLLNDTTTFRPYANNTLDLGVSGARWKNGWFVGNVTSGSITVSGAIHNDHNSASYDVWIQGGSASSGEARNLALLGVTTNDILYVNHSSEYTGGTIVGGPVTLNGNSTVSGTAHITGAITAPAGTIRDSGGGWVRTYGATGWYNQTYGGGWYMTDATWVRAYSNKSVVTGGNMQAAAFLYGSDARLKADIKPLELSLEALDDINAYRYHYKADENKTPRIGVLAQEVKAVFPEAVKTGEDGMMSVDYPSLVPVLLDAVKQLKAENDAIRRQMKADNDNLREEIRALTKEAQ